MKHIAIGQLATIAELEAAANEQVRRLGRLPPDYQFADPLAPPAHPPTTPPAGADQDTAA